MDFKPTNMNAAYDTKKAGRSIKPHDESSKMIPEHTATALSAICREREENTHSSLQLSKMFEVVSNPIKVSLSTLNIPKYTGGYIL